jgi:hypothetical protein
VCTYVWDYLLTYGNKMTASPIFESGGGEKRGMRDRGVCMLTECYGSPLVRVLYM